MRAPAIDQKADTGEQCLAPASRLNRESSQTPTANQDHFTFTVDNQSVEETRLDIKITGEIAGRRTSVHDTVTSHEQPVEVRTTEGIGDMGKQQYQPVGRCIYCEATKDLTREHIIPFGLSGTAVLPNASCKSCSRITGAFELQVLRGSMRAARVLRRLRSRRNHADAPTTQRLTIVRGGVEELVELPLDQYPILLHFPIFPPPQFLTGKQSPGIAVSGVHSILFGPLPEEVLRRLGGQKIIFSPPGDQPHAFARMLAKIAYAMAVAQGFDKALNGPSCVVPAILGEYANMGRWVGTITGPNRKYPGLLHRVAIHTDLDRGLLLAEIQLFADSESPSYGVILGTLRRE